MKKSILGLAALATAFGGLATATPAAADPPRWAPAHGHRDKHAPVVVVQRAPVRPVVVVQRAPVRPVQVVRVYDDRGYYVQPRRITRSSYVWRGDGGRYYCRRDNGTTGLIIGAGVGALAGAEIAGRGDRTLGAILGGVAGGLLGRSIDRGDLQCR